MLTNHPDIRIADCNMQTNEIQIENIPDNYLTQLLDAARRYDGTDFFKNLELSYRTLVARKQKT